MPIVRLQENQSVEAEWNAQRLFPLRRVERILLEDLGIELRELTISKLAQRLL